MINEELADLRYFAHGQYKLVITRLSRTFWPIFCSFLIFCCYLTRLKAREISRWKMGKLEHIGRIVLETVR